MSYPINQTVTEVGQINFTGNVTPHTWYTHLRYPNGKPHLNAITILGEIVYWYRPRIIRDEATGGILRIEKRFKADKLQRSYQSFVIQFGLTKKQVRDAVNFLVDFGVTTKELRDITIADGTPLYNVLYHEVVPAKLREINQVTPSALQVTPPDIEVTPPIPVGQTNTETTTQTTSETKDDFENSPITEKQPPALDLLSHQFDVVTSADPPTETTGPNPDDAWVEYGTKIWQLYKQQTAIKTLNPEQRGALSLMADDPNFDWQKFQKYLAAFALSGGFAYNVGGFITGYSVWLRTGDIDAAMGRRNGGQPKPERRVKYTAVKRAGVK